MTEPPALPTDPSAPPPAAARAESRAELRAAAPARCPRCGAPMGRLAVDDGPADEATRYCGCCGLVLPAMPREARP